MSFSDEDLKWLKEMIETNYQGHPSGHAQAVQEFILFKSESLLARLEAAEAFIAMCQNACPDWEGTALYKAWRKSAGRLSASEESKGEL